MKCSLFTSDSPSTLSLGLPHACPDSPIVQANFCLIDSGQNLYLTSALHAETDTVISAKG